MTPSPHATAERRRIAERATKAERRRITRAIRAHQAYFTEMCDWAKRVNVDPRNWKLGENTCSEILSIIRAPKKPKGREK